MEREDNFQVGIFRDIIKIKNLTEQIEATSKRKESKIKYTLMLEELEEMTECIKRIKQHANIEVHLIETRS